MVIVVTVAVAVAVVGDVTAASATTADRYVSQIPGSGYGPNDRVVALTFDDGPDPVYTPQVLSVLQQLDVKATFFEVGRNAAAHPDLTRRIAAAGSSVQNHTWNHADLTKVAPNGWLDEVDHTTSLLGSLTHSSISCLRPPYGATSGAVLDQAAKRNLAPVLWSADSEDWQRPGVPAIVNNALIGLRPGSIILMHDGGGDRSQTVAALPAIIKSIRAQGYSFVPLCTPKEPPPPPTYETRAFAFGDSVNSQGVVTSKAPFTGAASAGNGSWVTATDGGVFAFDGAEFHGSMGGVPLNQPIVGIARTRSNDGYWLVAQDGGIFSFGNAQFYGSTGSITLNQPIVGMVATASGGGYWMVAADGGVFAFGDAQFYGSMGGTAINEPIVGITATADGGGYWLVAKDGGIFSFGNAQFYGSTGSLDLRQPIVGMASTSDGAGYWMIAADGGVFTFGDAPFFGSRAGADDADVFLALVPSADGLGYLVVGQHRQ